MEPSQGQVNPFRKRFRFGEDMVSWFLLAMASLAVLVSGAIIWTLVDGSFSFFTDSRVDVFDFFTGTVWSPNGAHPSFGMLPLFQGTLIIAGGALLLGAPTGVAAALYLSEFASPTMRAVLKPIVELLAGIPSIVYGFFALLVISPFFREHFDATYFNAASAIVVMAAMVLPIIVSVSDDSMKAVPRHLREASFALGATKWETSTRVVMPAASSGIAASILLALARAIGETMVVALAAGSVAIFSWNPMDEHMTMTSYIAQVATGDIPPGIGVDAAFAVGLVLFAMTFAINWMAGRVVLRIQRGGGTANGGKGVFSKISAIPSRLMISITDGFRSAAMSARQSSRRWTERLGKSVLGLSFLVCIAFLGLLLHSIVEQGWTGLTWHFLTEYPSYKPEKAGIYPVILGSVYLVLLTMAIAMPVGIGAAIYLNEFARETWYNTFLRRIIQNLAGVPSIVFGLVGLAIFVRYFSLGPSLIAGGLTLATMALPVIVVTSEEALRSVPQSFREAARGLGATRWQTVWHHVLPNAVPGILTGSILALSRSLGETAPILFIAGFFSKVAPSSITDGFLALPVTIFYWTKHPKEEFQVLAATTILVLLAILMLLNGAAIAVRQVSQSRRKW